MRHGTAAPDAYPPPGGTARTLRPASAVAPGATVTTAPAGDAAPAPRRRGAEWRPLHIAMVGQKGLPATYGGVEHHVEELGRRLVARGHRVTAYCRRGYGGWPDAVPGTTGQHHGIELVTTPALRSKHLDALTHSATSSAHAVRAGVDVVHLHALGPGLLSPFVRAAPGVRVVQTVHGLDHERAKWGGLARRVLGLGHTVSGHAPDELVVVSRALQEHYRRRFGRESVLAPNGTPVPRDVPRSVLDPLLGRALGSDGGRYLLFVGRLVPEKRPDLLLRAFRRVADPDVRLVVVGDSSFSDDVTAALHEQARLDPRVVLTGYQYGDLLAALMQHAEAFVQPSALEGMPLTVLEALAAGTRVVASDIAPHVELLGRVPSRHRLVPVDDAGALAAALREVLATGRPAASSTTSGSTTRPVAADPVRERVLAEHSWDTATDLLEDVYLSVTATTRR